VLSIDRDIIRHPESPIRQIALSANDLQIFLPGLLTPLRSPDKREVGGQFGVSFPLQTPISRLVNSGTDARFPYEVRQIVVIG